MGNILFSDNSEVLNINTKSDEPIKNLNPKINKILFNSNCTGNPPLILYDNLSVRTIDLSKKYYYREELENLPPKLENLYLEPWVF